MPSFKEFPKSSFQDLYEYDELVPPSDEVLLYGERFDWLLNTDWADRAHARFRDFYETRATKDRDRGIGALATYITQRELLQEIQLLDAHIALELVPDYIDFEH